MYTVPALIARATRCALPTFCVHRPAARPNWVSLARLSTSASSSKGITDSTGPKISSCATRMELLTPASTVGW